MLIYENDKFIYDYQIFINENGLFVIKNLNYHFPSFRLSAINSFSFFP